MCVELFLWLLKSKSLHKRVPVAVGTGQSRFLPDRVTAVPLWVQSPGLVSARSSILVRNMNVSQSGGVYPPWQWWMDGQPGVNVVLRGRLAWQRGAYGWCKPVILSRTRCQYASTYSPSPSSYTHTHQGRHMIIFPKSRAFLPLPQYGQQAVTELTSRRRRSADHWATLMLKWLVCWCWFPSVGIHSSVSKLPNFTKLNREFELIWF